MSVLETCTPRDKLLCPCISMTSPDPPLERKQFLFGLRTKLSPTFQLQETLYGAHSFTFRRLGCLSVRLVGSMMKVIFGLARVLMLA
jgi:hypothetical protein